MTTERTFHDRLRDAYHALVPKAIRYPIGHARRWLDDRWLRWRTPQPIPPARMLQSVQLTAWAREYLAVGARSAETITDALTEGPSPDGRSSIRVLDFGCGLGRTLRHLDHPGWQLVGCDVDRAAIAWSARALPTADFAITGTTAALPFRDAAFDAAYAVSVFTHFDGDAQRAWAAELARLVRPGGRLVISTMGRHALGNFAELDGPTARAALADEGFWYQGGGRTFNANGAFHTEAGIEWLFGRDFRLVRWTAGGLDGFQDLTVLVRVTPRA